MVTHAVARRRRPKRVPFVGVSFLFTLGFGLKPLVGRLKAEASFFGARVAKWRAGKLTGRQDFPSIAGLVRRCLGPRRGEVRRHEDETGERRTPVTFRRILAELR